jgi:hypothetical protein
VAVKRIGRFVYSVVYNKVYELPEVFPSELAGLLPHTPRREYWMFRAIGWAPGVGEKLVVRGIGHDPGFPHQDYGCEFAVDFSWTRDYSARLLRAYRRELK